MPHRSSTREFQRLLAAEGISNFGAMLSRLAIPWLAALVLLVADGTVSLQAAKRIFAELAGNDEATALVAALERQYDAFQRGRELPGLLATDVGPVPSADEIGAELEAYLKDVTADPPATDEQG